MSSKTEEKVRIEIEDNEGGSFIKDYDYSLSTNDKNEAIITTELLQCELDSLIISADKKCEVIVRFAPLPDVVIFNEMEYQGTKYIPIRTQTFNEENKLLTSGAAKFVLNNKIEIIIKGSVQTKANVTLRCSNA